MTINLERYQAPMPYPLVREAKRDPRLAATLMEGYAGEYSELTTVLQYAYHSLRCGRYPEISQTMRGIFYVETLHMELLGDCVQRLGGDPRYLLELREKTVCWQSQLVDYGESAGQMLLLDLEGEKGAVEFYQQTAAAVEQPEIAALLSRLAEDEKLHVQQLTELYNTHFPRDAGRKPRR